MVVGQGGEPDGGFESWPEIKPNLPLTLRGVKEKFAQARDSVRKLVPFRVRRPPLLSCRCRGHCS